MGDDDQFEELRALAAEAVEELRALRERLDQILERLDTGNELLRKLNESQWA